MPAIHADLTPQQAFRRSLSGLVEDYLSVYRDETQSLEQLVRQACDRQTDIFDRNTLPGHLTASGIVLRAGRVLMIAHPVLDLWLQPGGHVEPGEVPLAAAIREVEEETGLKSVAHAWHARATIPFDIDIHRIPANVRKQEPEHLHYDFRYLLLPAADGDTGSGPEKLPTRWEGPDRLRDGVLARLIAKLEQARVI